MGLLKNITQEKENLEQVLVKEKEDFLINIAQEKQNLEEVMKNNLKEKKNLLEKFSQQKEKLEQSLIDANDKNIDLKNMNNKQLVEIYDLKEEYNLVENEIKVLKNHKIEKENELNEKIQNLKNNFEKLFKEKNSLYAENIQIKKDLQNYEQKNKILSNKVDKFHNRIQNLT